MRIFKFLLLTLGLISTPVFGADVLIKGSGSGYNNAELRFYSQPDPVTKRLKPLLKTRCSQEGTFSAQLQCDKPELIFIDAGTFRFRLYINGGSDYVLKLPDYVGKSKEEEQNPFFRATELMPLVDTKKDDLNNLIHEFDNNFDPVFNFIADRVMRNTRNADLQNEAAKLDKYPGANSDPFYINYVSCRKLMLNLVYNSSPVDKQKTFDFLNSGFDPYNVAFTDLAEQIFTGYLTDLQNGRFKDSFSRAFATASLSELRSIVLRDNKIKNKELLDYVILLNLNKMYYEKSMPGDNIRKFLILMRSQGETDFIRSISSLQTGLISSLLPGNDLPDFSLAGSDGENKSIKDFHGKYLLLNFARSDNPPSLTELGILKSWQKKYDNDLNIASVLTDEDYASGLARMKNNGFQWTFLNGSDRDELEYTYNIIMYPSFILLDREGKVVFNPCIYPSEELELKIGSIINAGKGGLISQD